MAVVDFGILTGLIEEFDVLRRLLPDLAEQPDGWYRGEFPAENGVVYSIVATFQDKMGPLDASSVTAKLIDRWNPAYILLLGIAGSFSSDVHLGDVIVSQQVFLLKPTDTSGTSDDFQALVERLEDEERKLQTRTFFEPAIEGQPAHEREQRELEYEGGEPQHWAGYQEEMDEQQAREEEQREEEARAQQQATYLKQTY